MYTDSLLHTHTELHIMYVVVYIHVHTLSMSTASSSGKGAALMNSRLCLLGDLERQVTEDSASTVSRYETTGSDFLRGMQA